jgi:hypothetical protein
MGVESKQDLTVTKSGCDEMKMSVHSWLMRFWYGNAKFLGWSFGHLISYTFDTGGTDGTIVRIHEYTSSFAEVSTQFTSTRFYCSLNDLSVISMMLIFPGVSW